MINLGPEYGSIDIDVSGFTKRDWNLIKYALNSTIDKDSNISENDIEDMQTIINIIDGAKSDSSVRSLSWKDAIKATEYQFKVMGKDDSDLDVIKQFCEEADYGDEEELNEHWSKNDVDIALANLRIDMNDGDPECYEAIEEAVIHFEDFLD